MNVPVVDECRWCGVPIRLVQTGSGPGWVHDVPNGAFYCRDERSRMCLPTYAQPINPPLPTRRTAGRHAIGVAPGTATQRAG